jgi:Fe2+ transport system protein FeoA
MKNTEYDTVQAGLDAVEAKQDMVVADIRGGWGVRQRLNQMGIHVEDVIRVRRCCSMGGPILVRIHGTDIALGRGLARHVLVIPAGEGKS